MDMVPLEPDQLVDIATHVENKLSAIMGAFE
jgi:hypothetical protein